MDFSLISLTIPLIWLSNIHMSTPEPIVTLHFYEPRVFKLNVKEYVSVDGTGHITIGCDVNNFFRLSGTIVLSSGNITLKESPLSNRPLIWKGILSLPSNLCCTALLLKEMNFDDNITSWSFNIKSTVRLTPLDVHPSKETSGGICMPKENNGKFLPNEVVPIICLSDELNANWTTNVELLMSPEWFFKLSSGRRVIQNYIRMSESLSGKEAKCIKRKNDTHTFCKIQLASLKSEHDVVTIKMDPVTIPNDVLSVPLGFTCKTNLPTERINWRVDSTWGNILEFGYGYVPRWNFSISHFRSTSELTFPHGINRLVAVSCWTDRAGSVVMATASNQSVLQLPNLKMQTLSATSPKYIIVTAALALTCVTLLFAMIFILRRKSQRSQRGSEVVGYVVSDPTSAQNSHLSVYTSIQELSTATNENMGSKQDIRTKKTRRSTDELSVGILEDESEDYIYNAIYDCIE